MKIAVISFSQRGGELGSRIKKALQPSGFETEVYLNSYTYIDGMQAFDDLDLLMKVVFPRYQTLIFIGAAQVAVRAVAPYLKSKSTDPALIVIDEMAKHVIPLLPGPTGINDFAIRLSSVIHSNPVITKLSDNKRIFSVETFAKKNHLRILTPELVPALTKTIQARQKIGLFCEPDDISAGDVPEEIAYYSDKTTLTGPLPNDGICISYMRPACFRQTVYMKPMDYVIGISFQRGTVFENVKTYLEEMFVSEWLDLERISKIVSVEMRGDDLLQRIAAAYNVPFETYSSKDLATVTDGNLKAVDIAGVDNVCERSACMGSNHGKAIIRKQTFNGVSISVYQRVVTLRF